MAGCGSSTTRTSRRIRIEIAKEYLRKKKQWDIPNETRTVIKNLIDLAEDLLTESAEADKLRFRDDLSITLSKKPTN